jgi:hypothetical protein
MVLRSKNVITANVTVLLAQMIPVATVATLDTIPTRLQTFVRVVLVFGDRDVQLVIAALVSVVILIGSKMVVLLSPLLTAVFIVCSSPTVQPA